ncbi:MAG TPA: PadR family transcriptional regulator [Dictyobacter sp.]|jgi:DNA-binding PadR family transcriptional regulator|nr:PadR family transcriptional regulator [Dictyobacter sp.]
MQISEPAEYTLLGLLTIRPMHGYEMFQHFENGVLGQIVHLEMSQMYAFLKKLERLQYIEAEIELQGARPPRKIFHLTTEGQQTFRSWLQDPVQKPRDIRILFLIKLYFTRRFQPSHTISLIQQQIIACQQFLENLQSQQIISDTSIENEDIAFFEHVVIRSRTYQTQALLEWLNELQRDAVRGSGQ